MIVYGAGMAGLLSAGMLRRFNPEVHEAQPSLPDNHGALLRFRTEEVSRATAIPFRRVRVLKAVKVGTELISQANLAHSNLYSLKVTGKVMTRSILDTSPVERYIAPDNFIRVLASGCSLHYGSPLTLERLEAHRLAGESIISTIPMNKLMDIVGWEHRPRFGDFFRGITSVRLLVDGPQVDVYQTVYYPEPHLPYYRASITGRLITIEFMDQPTVTPSHTKHVLRDFGLEGASFTTLPPSFQSYGKLLPIGEKVRREFIMAMTDQFRVYSVGRFATWRQILLDDVVRDVGLVSGWIQSRDGYARSLHYSQA